MLSHVYTSWYSSWCLQALLYWLCAEGCSTTAPTVPNATPSQQTNHRRQGATVTYTCSQGYAFDSRTLRTTSQSTCTNQAVWSDPGACIGTAFFSDFVFFCFFFFLFNKLFFCLWRYRLYSHRRVPYPISTINTWESMRFFGYWI